MKIEVRPGTHPIVEAIVHDKGGVIVPRALTKVLGGDFLAAAVLKQMCFWWSRKHGGKERDGHHWIAQSQVDLADKLGITKEQARGALERLVERWKLLIKGGPWMFAGAPTNHYRPDPEAVEALGLYQESRWPDRTRPNGPTPPVGSGISAQTERVDSPLPLGGPDNSITEQSPEQSARADCLLPRGQELDSGFAGALPSPWGQQPGEIGQIRGTGGGSAISGDFGLPPSAPPGTPGSAHASPSVPATIPTPRPLLDLQAPPVGAPGHPSPPPPSAPSSPGPGSPPAEPGAAACDPPPSHCFGCESGWASHHPRCLHGNDRPSDDIEEFETTGDEADFQLLTQQWEDDGELDDGELDDGELERHAALVAQYRHDPGDA